MIGMRVVWAYMEKKMTGRMRVNMDMNMRIRVRVRVGLKVRWYKSGSKSEGG
jgi:hypothetical protein